jgi:membrane protein DedA with SNARE-associated domain
VEAQARGEEGGVPLWAEHAIETFGYAAVFLLVAIEGLGVPVPGETALLVAGALAGAGNLDIRIVIAVAAVAAIAGDSGGYWMGRRWGRALLDRWGHRFGLTAGRVAYLDRFFHRYGILAVFFGRYQAVFRTYIGLFAGMARMPFGRFFVVRFASCIVWAIIYGLVAYYLGQQWGRVQAVLHGFGLASIAGGALLAAVAAIAFLARRRAQRARALAASADEERAPEEARR